ncbi:MAG: hypothetical protein U0640_00205 [Phycisphaerales bacterium]
MISDVLLMLGAARSVLALAAWARRIARVFGSYTPWSAGGSR